jgi:hypothetical protein
MAGEIRAIYGKIKLTDEASGAINQLKKSMNGFKEGLGNIHSMMEAVGSTYLLNKVREFGAELINAAANEETQMLRLRHLAGAGYGSIQESIKGAVEASKGLADDSDMAQAANSALKLGASIDFVRSNLQPMQQLSKIMGTDLNETFSGMQNAINTGSIRFLRQSPILVQHINEFKKIGAGYDEVTKKRREMFMTQILSNEQTKLLQQYNEYLETTDALTGRVSTQWHKMKEVMGGMILTVLKPFIKYLGEIMTWLMKDERGLVIFRAAVVFLASAIGVLLVPVLATAVSSLTALLGISKGFMLMVGKIALVLTLLAAVIEDFYHGFGAQEKQSVTEDWINLFKGLGSKFDNLPGIKQLNEKTFWKGDKKASGGAVSGGRSVLVGERGPELFTPGTSGNITPNHALGGVTIGSLINSLVIHAGSGDIGGAIEMEVMDALNRLSRTIMRTELGMNAI